MATSSYGTTPSDYATPDWDNCGKVHDWKNYISDEVRLMWHEFTVPQRAALARMADAQADRERWD